MRLRQGWVAVYRSKRRHIKKTKCIFLEQDTSIRAVFKMNFKLKQTNYKEEYSKPTDFKDKSFSQLTPLHGLP